MAISKKKWSSTPYQGTEKIHFFLKQPLFLAVFILFYLYFFKVLAEKHSFDF